MAAPVGRCSNVLDDLLKDLETTVESTVTENSNSGMKFVPRPPNIEKSTTVVNPKSKFVSMRTSRRDEATRNSSQSADYASHHLDNILDLIGSTSPDKAVSLASGPSGLPNMTAAKSYDSVAASSEVPKSLQSVDDFLNDLDAALMPSPRGGTVAAVASGQPDNASTPKSTLSSGRHQGSSLKQRMFPATSSPADTSSVGDKGAGLLAGSLKQPSEITLLPSVGVGTLPNMAVGGLAQGQNSVVTGKLSKCCRVTLAGAAITRGYKSSAFSKCACDNLLCIQCNFKVMYFIGHQWDPDVDYMFFRNANTNVNKLNEKLVCPSGPGDGVGKFCAYCCQCSWADVQEERPLAPASGVGTDQLHWVCAGHQTT